MTEPASLEEIRVRSIGVVHAPCREPGDLPIQGAFGDDTEAYIELKERYVPGLQDLDGFSHAWVITNFHRSSREELVGRPYLERQKHGIFAIRSPHRPNHLGLSVIRITGIAGNRVYFRGVDMLDRTPVLDIKPYVPGFDRRDNVAVGWLQPHLEESEQ